MDESDLFPFLLMFRHMHVLREYGDRSVLREVIG